jgi:catechol 2,3-dioxygenase-like lactoylglutathione lyase family enzyme
VDAGRPEAHARHRAAREDPGGVGRILTRIDHVTVGVADLEAGIDAYRRIGFDVDERGVAPCDDDYLEIAQDGNGLRSIVLRSDDHEGDQAAMRSRGAADWVELAGGRLISGRSHPNGVQRIERAYIAVQDVAAAAATYARVLGARPPNMERGAVINADMAIFQFGHTAIGLAQPAGPGVCADALSSRGPGPFQVLYRTTSMDAAAKWMAGHGVPPPKRGVRNTGEQAMLVAPEHACGVFIGFVGPA